MGRSLDLYTKITVSFFPLWWHYFPSGVQSLGIMCENWELRWIQSDIGNILVQLRVEKEIPNA